MADPTGMRDELQYMLGHIHEIPGARDQFGLIDRERRWAIPSRGRRDSVERFSVLSFKDEDRINFGIASEVGHKERAISSGGEEMGWLLVTVARPPKGLRALARIVRAALERTIKSSAWLSAEPDDDRDYARRVADRVTRLTMIETLSQRLEEIEREVGA